MYRILLLLACTYLVPFHYGIGQSADSILYKQYQIDKQLFRDFEAQHRGFVNAANTKLSYLSWGDSKNKAFVWLPGSLLSAYDFEPFAASLVKDGYFVISVDHYGHGLASIPEEDLNFSDFAEDLSVLLDTMEIGKAVIAGFSRGGYLATEFYKCYPERVSAVILEDGGSVAFNSAFLKMPPAQLASFLQSVSLPENIHKRYFDIYDSEFEVYRNFYDKEIGGSQFQNLGFIRSFNGKWIGYHGLNEYMYVQDSCHYSRLLFQPETVSKYAASIVLQQPKEIYQRLDVPMLILDAVGTPDLFENAIENKQLAALFPHLITYRAFDCADHNIHYICPEEFLETVKNFLYKHTNPETRF